MNIHSNTDILAKVLDATWMRNEVIANNLANVETPGYKRKDVAFEAYLDQALRANDKLEGRRLSEVAPKVYTDNSSLSYKVDGNNVNVDTESAYLTQNAMKYSILIDQVNHNFNRLQIVLNK